MAEERDIIDEINVLQLTQLRDLLQFIERYLKEPDDATHRDLQKLARKLSDEGWQGNIKKIAKGDTSVLLATADEIRSIQDRFQAKFNPKTPEREKQIRDTVAAIEAGRREAERLYDEMKEGLAKVRRNVVHSRGNEPPALKAAPVQASNPAEYLFRKSGEGWRLAFNGIETHVKELVGMYYLRELLSRRDQPIAATTLEANRASRQDVDRRGRSGAYLTSDDLKELQNDLIDRRQALAEAIAASNDILSAEIEAEIDALQSRIISETGLGGRSRSDNDSEKARTAVTNAVTRAITAISREHPALGNHLTAFVTTGTICQYSPDQKIEWSV